MKFSIRTQKKAIKCTQQRKLQKKEARKKKHSCILDRLFMEILNNWGIFFFFHSPVKTSPVHFFWHQSWLTRTRMSFMKLKCDDIILKKIG